MGLYGLRRLCTGAGGLEFDGYKYFGQSSARTRLLERARSDSNDTEVYCEWLVIAIPVPNAKSMLKQLVFRAPSGV